MAIACDANSLLNNASCLDCIPAGLQNDVIIYLLCVISGVNPDPNALMAAASQFQSIPDGLKPDIIAYLECQIATAAGA